MYARDQKVYDIICTNYTMEGVEGCEDCLRKTTNVYEVVRLRQYSSA